MICKSAETLLCTYSAVLCGVMEMSISLAKPPKAIYKVVHISKKKKLKKIQRLFFLNLECNSKKQKLIPTS